MHFADCFLATTTRKAGGNKFNRSWLNLKLVLVGAIGKLDVQTGVLADPLLGVFKDHLCN